MLRPYDMGGWLVDWWIGGLVDWGGGAIANGIGVAGEFMGISMGYKHRRGEAFGRQPFHHHINP
jgi:hypothetical protein